MKYLIILAVMMLAFMSSANADECASLVGRIVQLENAQFTSRSPSGNIYFLKHQLSHEISVNCGADSLGPMIGIDFDQVPFPSEPMFLLTARLGAMLTGISQPVLLKALHSCHQEALRETRAEEADRDMTHGVQLECHAFTRDGGASAFFISTDISAK